MNSGVPGSPRSGGPPFHAYQYVRRVPSASCFVIELMPFRRTRMFRDPLVDFVGFLLLVFGDRDHDRVVGPHFVDERHARPGGLLERAGERRLARLPPAARGAERTVVFKGELSSSLYNYP